MTTWFISRHPGALEWTRRRQVPVDRFVAHLELRDVVADDTVIGSLPIHLAAAVCAQGARYLHLCVELPSHLRRQELTADQLDALGAHTVAYQIVALASPQP